MTSAALVAEGSAAVGEVLVDKASVGSPGKSVLVGVAELWIDDNESVLTTPVAEGFPLATKTEVFVESEEHFVLCEDLVVGLVRQDEPVREAWLLPVPDPVCECPSL